MLGSSDVKVSAILAQPSRYASPQDVHALAQEHGLHAVQTSYCCDPHPDLFTFCRSGGTIRTGPVYIPAKSRPGKQSVSKCTTCSGVVDERGEEARSYDVLSRILATVPQPPPPSNEPVGCLVGGTRTDIDNYYDRVMRS